MRKQLCWIISLSIFLVLPGCDTALVTGGKTMGFRSGQFFYSDNAVSRLYKFPLDPVWEACDKALADLKASSIEKKRGISAGKIKAIIQDETATIAIEYVSKDMTKLSISIGTAKNNVASEMIHEKIAQHLADLLSNKPSL